jgi:hypothetical protein
MTIKRVMPKRILSEIISADGKYIAETSLMRVRTKSSMTIDNLNAFVTLPALYSLFLMAMSSGNIL